MIEPLSAEYFLSDLLSSEEVVAACRADLGISASDVLTNAATGDAEEFLEWFEQWRKSQASESLVSVEAATLEEEYYLIHIGRAGPIYWVTGAPDDSESDEAIYYRTLQEAEREARELNFFDIHRREQIKQRKERLGRRLLGSLLRDAEEDCVDDEKPVTKPNEWCNQKFTIAEAEHANTRPGQLPFGGLAAEWELLKSQAQEGDEIWSYCSPEATWKAMCGRQGIWLIRNGKIVYDIVTLMN
jgi:uncharacterized protein (DUF427 family)